MKYLIKIENSFFAVSRSLAGAMIKSKPSLQQEINDKETVIILTDYDLFLFQSVSTTSLTHFYALIFGKKHRVSKNLYSALIVKKGITNDIKKHCKKVAETSVITPLT